MNWEEISLQLIVGFSTEPKNFYKIDAFDTNYSKQHKLALENNFVRKLM